MILCVCIGDGNAGLKLLDDEECICPGQYLTYECTVVGELGGMSVWRGSVFNCTSQEISLFHNKYESGAFGQCGDITGQSLKVNTTDGNNSIGYFVSQLSVPAGSNTAGKDIACQYDDGDAVVSVGEMTIPAVTGYSSL